MLEAVPRSKSGPMRSGPWPKARVVKPQHMLPRDPFSPGSGTCTWGRRGVPCLLRLQPSSGESERHGPGRLHGRGALRLCSPPPIPEEQRDLHTHIPLPQGRPPPRWDTPASERCQRPPSPRHPDARPKPLPSLLPGPAQGRGAEGACPGQQAPQGKETLSRSGGGDGARDGSPGPAALRRARGHAPLLQLSSCSCSEAAWLNLACALPSLHAADPGHAGTSFTGREGR